jgi:DNA ligase 1
VTRFPPLTLTEPGAARLRHVEYCESIAGKDAVEDFWLKAVDSRCEGVMIKVVIVVLIHVKGG